MRHQTRKNQANARRCEVVWLTVMNLSQTEKNYEERNKTRAYASDDYVRLLLYEEDDPRQRL